MNSDECSVSHELVITNFPTYSTTSFSVTENTISNQLHLNGGNIFQSTICSHSDMATSLPLPPPEHENQSSFAEAGIDSEHHKSTTSKLKPENYLSKEELSKSSISCPDKVISEEIQSLQSNNESNIAHNKDDPGHWNIDKPEVTDLNSYSDSVSYLQKVSDATTEEPVSLSLEKSQANICSVTEQQQSLVLEVDVAESQCSPGLNVDGMHGQYSSAFVGPVQPSYLVQETVEMCDGTSFSGQDIPLASSPCIQRDSVSFTDDFRYNLSVESVPRLAGTACSEFQGVCENFLRGCKWSSDGSCVLTNSNDNCLRTFYPFDNTSTSQLSNNKQIVARVKIKECSQIYDFAWHPQVNVSQGDYGRIACTCSGIPIHLWDAATGQIVANYRAYDQFDEIAPAYSLAFSLDGRNIYAGYNKTIRIFDTDYPVRSCRTVKTYNSQSKDGQTGIISSFTFSPDGNGLYVAGSYSRHIGMYDSACDKLVCLMQGQHGGVTHLMFSPDSTKLYSGGRKDAEILCWDMRNMDKILFSALRDVKTNQRIYFDLSQSGRYLVSGNNDGTVAFWDTLSPIEEINGDSFLKPCSQFQAHGDCVNGVSFNHQHNMIATASGQRHFHNFDYDSSDSAEDEKMEGTEAWDFSLRLWEIPMLV